MFKFDGAIVSAHTPGPWKLDSFGLINGPDWNQNTGFLASVKILHNECLDRHSLNSSRLESIANARLIAAVPDLFEACQYVLSWINEGCPKFDKIHTRTKIELAIEKAEEPRSS